MSKNKNIMNNVYGNGSLGALNYSIQSQVNQKDVVNKFGALVNDPRISLTLKYLDLTHLLPKFSSNNISFNDLLLLSQNDLKELGFTVVERNRLLHFSDNFHQFSDNCSVKEIEQFFQEHKILNIRATSMNMNPERTNENDDFYISNEDINSNYNNNQNANIRGNGNSKGTFNNNEQNINNDNKEVSNKNNNKNINNYLIKNKNANLFNNTTVNKNNKNNNNNLYNNNNIYNNINNNNLNNNNKNEKLQSIKINNSFSTGYVLNASINSNNKKTLGTNNNKNEPRTFKKNDKFKLNNLCTYNNNNSNCETRNNIYKKYYEITEEVENYLQKYNDNKKKGHQRNFSAMRIANKKDSSNSNILLDKNILDSKDHKKNYSLNKYSDNNNMKTAESNKNSYKSNNNNFDRTIAKENIDRLNELSNRKEMLKKLLGNYDVQIEEKKKILKYLEKDN